jgi:chemotaxis protein histidine kinase CheA
LGRTPLGRTPGAGGADAEEAEGGDPDLDAIRARLANVNGGASAPSTTPHVAHGPAAEKAEAERLKAARLAENAEAARLKAETSKLEAEQAEAKAAIGGSTAKRVATQKRLVADKVGEAADKEGEVAAAHAAVMARKQERAANKEAARLEWIAQQQSQQSQQAGCAIEGAIEGAKDESAIEGAIEGAKDESADPSSAAESTALVPTVGGAAPSPSPPNQSAPVYWERMRGVLLMSDAEQQGAHPLTPEEVRSAAHALQLPLGAISARSMENGVALLPIVLEYLDVPLPFGWRRHALDESGSQDGARATQLFVHAMRQLRTTAHPLMPTFRQVLRGLLRRTPSALAAHRAVDSLGWLLFAGADGTVYYFNFRTSQMSSSFPSLAELPADMPLLRPRAKGRGAAAYEGVVPAYLAARSHTQLLLSHGVATHASLEAASCGVRSSHLWMRPCALSTTLAAAQTLGIDPRREPHYMWLAHLSLCLPLPIGWEARATPAEAEWKALPGGLKLQQRRRKVELDMHLRGFAQPPLPDTYYEYRMLGFSVTQWERPQLSFCRGVLAALRKHAALGEAGLVPADGAPAAADAQAAAARAQEMTNQLQLMRERPQGATLAFATALSGRKAVRILRPVIREA